MAASPPSRANQRALVARRLSKESFIMVHNFLDIAIAEILIIQVNFDLVF